MALAISKWLTLEKKPAKGLLAVEWAMIAYLVLTLVVMLVAHTKLFNPEAMLKGRLNIVATTAAMWAVYRLVPCRVTMVLRVVVQMLMLSWWYPDTYEINRIFPNLDHVFAAAEQCVFGCQPALLFSETFSHPVISELMDLGYFSYYPMICVVLVFYCCWHYKQLDRAAFIVGGSFFIYYTIYIFLPVTGPQYYYNAVGVADIARGVFPNMGDYFATHQETLASPGWGDGLFYKLVANAHSAGERPTAAFPSSHVGVSTILMILAWMTRSRRLFFLLLPFYVLLCLSTVYIYAHYAVDVFGGWLTAIAIFAVLYFVHSKYFER